MNCECHIYIWNKFDLPTTSHVLKHRNTCFFYSDGNHRSSFIYTSSSSAPSSSLPSATFSISLHCVYIFLKARGKRKMREPPKILRETRTSNLMSDFCFRLLHWQVVSCQIACPHAIGSNRVSSLPQGKQEIRKPKPENRFFSQTVLAFLANFDEFILPAYFTNLAQIWPVV